MSRTFTYDGHVSSEYGVYVGETSSFQTPEREITDVVIPGRNGSLTRDGKRFNNNVITYQCYIVEDALEGFATLQELLLSSASYRKLEDSIDPDFFRKARVHAGSDFDIISSMHEQGTFQIEFDCLPQRFYKTGETAVEVTSTGTLVNPSKFTALPLIRIYGNGTVNVGDVQITVAEHADPYIDVDCDVRNCFYGSTNKNSFVTLTDHRYPELKAGNTGVSISGDITKVEITPRWWTV